MELFAVLLFWGLLCAGVGALASSRGRSGAGFFLLSFFFLPLLGLIVVLVAKNLTEEDAKGAERRREEDAREFDRKREHEKQLESLRVLAGVQATGDTAKAITAPSLSIADELMKLAKLREDGILTAPEFEAQKTALLQARPS